MRVRPTVLWTLMMAGAISPAMADDPAPMAAMKAGEVIAVMPDGQMAKATVIDTAKLDQLKKIAKRIPWCMMFMKGADGGVYMIDTSGHGPMVECENMVQ